MRIQLNPEHAAVVAAQAEAVGRTPDEVVGDILGLYQVAQRMAPIIPPPTADRDDIDAWEPPDDELGEFLASAIP
jgi:hypothetical protein